MRQSHSISLAAIRIYQIIIRWLYVKLKGGGINPEHKGLTWIQIECCVCVAWTTPTTGTMRIVWASSAKWPQQAEEISLGASPSVRCRSVKTDNSFAFDGGTWGIPGIWVLGWRTHSIRSNSAYVTSQQIWCLWRFIQAPANLEPVTSWSPIEDLFRPRKAFLMESLRESTSIPWTRSSRFQGSPGPFSSFRQPVVLNSSAAI